MNKLFKCKYSDKPIFGFLSRHKNSYMFSICDADLFDKLSLDVRLTEELKEDKITNRTYIYEFIQV